MAAYQQAKRMQRGVSIGYGENNVLGTNKFNMSPISIGTSDFTLEYFGNAYGSTMAVANNFLFQTGIIQVGASSLGRNDLYIVSLGGKSSKQLRFTAQNEDEKFHLVIARKVSEYTVTINNLLYDTVDMGEVKDLGNFSPVIMNSSDVGFVRVWNYALSADEIATLYNNGDPMGYVVPKAMRGEVFSYLSDFSSGTDGWKPASGNELSVEDGALLLTGPASPLYMTNSMSNNDRRPHIYSVELVVDTNPDISKVTCFAFQNSSPGRVNNGIDNGDGTTTYNIISPSGLSTYASTFQLGFDMTNVSPVKIRSIKLKTALCLAEYLPQNLMESRKGPEVEPTADVFEFDIDSSYSKRILSLRTYPFECFYKIDYIVDEWDFQPQTSGSIGFVGPQMIGPSSWYNIESAKIGQHQTCYAKMSSTGQTALDIYGGQKTDTTTSRRLKVTIVGITPVSVPISWLDSAKQLPLSDEYMEPLFQSIGGYDMAANGAPEILYNE